MAEEKSTPAFGPNAWLVDEMYEQYRQDPASVSESWQEFFADYRPSIGSNGSRDTPTETASPAPQPAAPAAVSAPATAEAARPAAPAGHSTVLRGAAART